MLNDTASMLYGFLSPSVLARVFQFSATLELRVKTVKYFKGLMDFHNLSVLD